MMRTAFQSPDFHRLLGRPSLEYSLRLDSMLRTFFLVAWQDVALMEDLQHGMPQLLLNKAVDPPREAYLSSVQIAHQRTPSLEEVRPLVAASAFTSLSAETLAQQYLTRLQVASPLSYAEKWFAGSPG
jgi:hypothetical protein